MITIAIVVCVCVCSNSNYGRETIFFWCEDSNFNRWYGQPVDRQMLSAASFARKWLVRLNYFSRLLSRARTRLVDDGLLNLNVWHMHTMMQQPNENVHDDVMTSVHHWDCLQYWLEKPYSLLARVNKAASTRRRIHQHQYSWKNVSNCYLISRDHRYLISRSCTIWSTYCASPFAGQNTLLEGLSISRVTQLVEPGFFFCLGN